MDDLNPLNKKQTYAVNPTDIPKPGPDIVEGTGGAERNAGNGLFSIGEVTRLAGHTAREHRSEADRAKSPSRDRAARKYEEIHRVLSELGSAKNPPNPEDLEARIDSRIAREFERLDYDWIKRDPRKNDEVSRNITALEGARELVREANEKPEEMRELLKRKDEKAQNEPLNMQELKTIAEHLEKVSARAAEQGDENAEKDEDMYGRIAVLITHIEENNGVIPFVGTLEKGESLEQFLNRKEMEAEVPLGLGMIISSDHLQEILAEADMYRRMAFFVKNAQKQPARLRELLARSPEAGLPQQLTPDKSSPLIPAELSQIAIHRVEQAQASGTSSTRESARRSAAVASILAEYASAPFPITGEALITDLRGRQADAGTLYGSSNESTRPGLDQRAADLENALDFVEQELGRNPEEEREILLKLVTSATIAADAKRLDDVRSKLGVVD